jgi:hypothetical protein
MSERTITFDKYAQEGMSPEARKALLYGLLGSAIAGGGVGMLRHFTPKEKDETTTQHTLKPALLAALAGGAAGAALPYGAKLMATGIEGSEPSLAGKGLNAITWPVSNFPAATAGAVAGAMPARLGWWRRWRQPSPTAGSSLWQRIHEQRDPAKKLYPYWGKSDIPGMQSVLNTYGPGGFAKVDPTMHKALTDLLAQYEKGTIGQGGLNIGLEQITAPHGAVGAALKARIQEAYQQSHAARPVFRDILSGGVAGGRGQYAGRVAKQLPGRLAMNIKAFLAREGALTLGQRGARWGLPVVGGIAGHALGKTLRGED